MTPWWRYSIGVNEMTLRLNLNLGYFTMKVVKFSKLKLGTHPWVWKLSLGYSKRYPGGTAGPPPCNSEPKSFKKLQRTIVGLYLARGKKSVTKCKFNESLTVRYNCWCFAFAAVSGEIFRAWLVKIPVFPKSNLLHGGHLTFFHYWFEVYSIDTP